ncbi:MAG: DegT/DnrJ/EryC1/StrS family aminotransferase [Sulfurimonas sp.]|uniref:DegT/DnrJ/EryC1/StrS family aminotransferase n=1 Tax=Sulfurimonas sp. TaxID=2022749 RepID=UPI0025CD04DC|nr:DegT/DnrJ/EryC1/StrS family aminotransferase [Sulfurimonas sp.]MCK9490920.1 DegT/DnrJ/EryC1/StrS family aminotransferase [Sulfurimonas sp.]
MKINFIDLQTQYLKYKEEIDSEMAEVLHLSEFIGGQKLDDLEKDLASFVGVKHAIACSSATDALLLSLMALNIGYGDEVITTPFAFVAAAEAVAFLGAKPIFVDIDKDSYNIDPSKIEAVITDRTKAIIPVSLFGQCADMDPINEIAKKHEIAVIEDASQSFGATYNEKKSCSLSTIGCTSFFPSNPLGAYGDGGALFTNDDELAQKIRVLINHGQDEKYKHKYIGINGRLDALQAAVLNVKLKYFEEEIKLRDDIGSRYSDLLEDAEIITPKVAENLTSVYAHYSIRVQDREAMLEKLNSKEIPTAICYPISIHLQEAFLYLGYKEGDFPISEEVSTQIISLPMSPYLTETEQDFIVEAIKAT